MSNQVKSKKKRQGRNLGGKILQLLSATAQALNTLGDFSYHPYPYLYASLGHVYGRETIDEAVGRLVKKGVVEGDKKRGLRLAPAGVDVKKSLYQERQKDWDGRWRVVIFDIPEVQRRVRDGLRLELKKLGFGQWQRSVWVTPFNISAELNAYLQKQDLSAVVQMLVGERFGGLSNRDFATRVWSLNELNEGYAHLLTEWKKELEKESTAAERLHTAAVFQSRYFDILIADPQLPLELLPSGWAGDDAKKLFGKLKSILTVGKAS